MWFVNTFFKKSLTNPHIAFVNSLAKYTKDKPNRDGVSRLFCEKSRETPSLFVRQKLGLFLNSSFLFSTLFYIITVSVYLNKMDRRLVVKSYLQ